MLDFTCHQEDASQSHSEMPFTSMRMAVITRQIITRVRKDVGKLVSSDTADGKRNMVQQLWKTAWHFLERLNIESPYDSAVPLLGIYSVQFSSVQSSRSVVSDSLWPHEPQHIRPPVHHQLLEFTQTHVHWVGDTIRPSHPLSTPSPALNLSQHQGLFKWVSSLHQVAQRIGVSASTSILPMNTQDWYSLGWTSWSSLELYTINYTHFVISVSRFLAFKATSMCENVQQFLVWAF